GYTTTAYLVRVPIDSILTISAYQWMTGFDGSGNPTWGAVANRVPIFTDANMADYNPSPVIVYIPALNKYLMVVSHYGPGGLGVFEADHPWGNTGGGWRTVGYWPSTVGNSWGPGTGYNSHPVNDEALNNTIVLKWTSLAGGTLTFWMVYSGFHT